MERIVKIHVEKLPEGLYLATSDEIQGLVAQGRTVAETMEIARDVWVEINKIEEEGKMPYISSVERIGYRQGKVEGRKEAIGLGLSLKFGDDVSLLMASISEIQDPDRLLTIMNAIFTACSIEEIRQLVEGKHGTA